MFGVARVLRVFYERVLVESVWDVPLIFFFCFAIWSYMTVFSLV